MICSYYAVFGGTIKIETTLSEEVVYEERQRPVFDVLFYCHVKFGVWVAEPLFIAIEPIVGSAEGEIPC